MQGRLSVSILVNREGDGCFALEYRVGQQGREVITMESQMPEEEESRDYTTRSSSYSKAPEAPRGDLFRTMSLPRPELKRATSHPCPPIAAPRPLARTPKMNRARGVLVKDVGTHCQPCLPPGGSQFAGFENHAKTLPRTHLTKDVFK